MLAPRKIALPVSLLAALTLSMTGAASAWADGGVPQDIHAKDTFAVVWARLQASGFRGEHEGLDWAALKAEHQPDIENATDIHGLRRELNELLVDLKASHLVLLPNEAVATSEATVPLDDTPYENESNVGGKDPVDAPVSPNASGTGGTPAATGYGDFGLRPTLVDGQVLVERVVPGFPAERAGVRPGWRIDRIARLNVSNAMAALRTQPQEASRNGETMLLGGVLALLDIYAPGETSNMRFIDREGRPHALALKAAPNPNIQPIFLPGIPQMPMRYGHRRIALPGGGCAVLIEFSQWAMPAFDNVVETLREHGGCRGAILDLRGNSGGMIASMGAIGGLFVDTPTSLGTLTTGGGELKLAALPRVVDNAGRDIRRFSGPLAILIDRGSVSCSDMFSASMQALGRARIFGVTSAGMALPAASTPLPSGDRLLYPIAEFVDAAGRRIEGVGTVPDQIVMPTVAALSAGGDPILDAALAWIGTDPKPKTAPLAAAPAATASDTASDATPHTTSRSGTTR
ncbi:MAG: hypothetical protein KA144_04180 [Xanthomonadaceae bacterium]|nr:hypothetical protein [Xanthomonadaceae bacterium]